MKYSSYLFVGSVIPDKYSSQLPAAGHTGTQTSFADEMHSLQITGHSSCRFKTCSASLKCLSRRLSRPQPEEYRACHGRDKMPYIEEEKNTLTANGQLPIPNLLWMYLKIEVDIGGCLRAQKYGAGLQHIEEALSRARMWTELRDEEGY